jgi:hypothetical protein
MSRAGQPLNVGVVPAGAVVVPLGVVPFRVEFGVVPL